MRGIAPRSAAFAAAVLLAAQAAHAQPAAPPAAAPAQQVTPAAPAPKQPGSKEVGIGALIGIVAGVAVLAFVVSD